MLRWPFEELQRALKGFKRLKSFKGLFKEPLRWCKFDITDPLEFHFLFEWKRQYGSKCSFGGPGCSNISPDGRFYKQGAARSSSTPRTMR